MSYRHPPTHDLRKLFRQADPPARLSLVFASCFGVGLIPVAPGTFGTLAGLPLALVLSGLGPLWSATFLFLFVLLAVWASGKSAKALKNTDPSEVVIDEIAGFLLAGFLLPATTVHLCLAFVLFRIFDIVKPFPIRRLESLPGGVGIVLDDLLAGVYANFCIRLGSLFFF